MECGTEPFSLPTEKYGSVNGRLHFNGGPPNRVNVINALCPALFLFKSTGC